MSLKTLIVNHKHLYEILNEISSQINFNVINGFEKGLNKDDYKSYLVINTKEEEEIKDQLLINNFPIKMKKLVEIININFLKKNYNFQSNIKIGEYKLCRIPFAPNYLLKYSFVIETEGYYFDT